MMDQTLCGPSLVKRLLKRIQDKLCLLRSGGAPADDLVGKHIDDECHIDKPLPGRDVSEGPPADAGGIICRNVVPGTA